MIGRLRAGDVLAGVAGAVLFASLFLNWYAVQGVTATGWASFSVIDLLLTLAAALAVALPIAQATRRSPAIPVALSVFTSTAGILATVLVAFRLLDQPGPNEFVEVRVGAWIGLAGALGVLAGGWLSMRDEHTPGSNPPDVPRRPAPPA